MSDCSIYSVMQKEIHAPCQLHELVNRESAGAHELFVERGGTFRRQSLDERGRACELGIAVENVGGTGQRVL